MKNLSRTILIIIGTVLLLAGGFWFYQNRSAEVSFTKGSYQAVFLSNGQVYFGKIKGLNEQYATLTDTYYLVRGQPIQPQTPPAEGEKQPQIAFGLRKLGESETHGPIDAMKINRDHILFIEELKDEGALVQAIKRQKTSPTEPTPGGEPTVQPSPTLESE